LKKPKDGELLNVNDYVTSFLLEERTCTVELEDLNPAEGPYYVIAMSWHAGIEGEFYLSVHSPGALSIKQIPSEKPSSAEAAQMARETIPHSSCGSCDQPFVTPGHKSVKGLRFHEKCYKCHDCGSVSYSPSEFDLAHAS